MLTFYHAPWSRSSGVFWLLEELGVDYSLEIVDIRAKGGVAESYRAIQPNKKVPAIVHDGVTVTERAAICIHLADAFPEAGLAPAIGDPRRGPYLTWMVYSDSVFDPAVAARAQEPGAEPAERERAQPAPQPAPQRPHPRSPPPPLLSPKVGILVRYFDPT